MTGPRTVLVSLALGLTLALAALAASPAAACDCATGEPTVAEAKVKLGIIVDARVVALEAGANPGTYVAKVFVLRAWKGAAAGDTIGIPFDGSDCGYRVAPGDELLIYAPAAAPVRQCAGDRTARLRMGDARAADLAALGPALGAAAVPAASTTTAAVVADGKVTYVLDVGRRGFEVTVTRGRRGATRHERLRVWSPVGACASSTVAAPAVGDRVTVEGNRFAWFGADAVLVSGCDAGTRVRVTRSALRTR